MQANNAPNHILFCQGLDQSITSEALTEVFMKFPGLRYSYVDAGMCDWRPKTTPSSSTRTSSRLEMLLRHSTKPN